jgi:hypothetical protein
MFCDADAHDAEQVQRALHHAAIPGGGARPDELAAPRIRRPAADTADARAAASARAAPSNQSIEICDGVKFWCEIDFGGRGREGEGGRGREGGREVVCQLRVCQLATAAACVQQRSRLLLPGIIFGVRLSGAGCCMGTSDKSTGAGGDNGTGKI